MREYTDQEICQIIQDYDRIIQELRYVVEAFVRELASLDSNDDWLCRLLALQHSGTGSATTHSSLHDLSDLLKNKKFKGMEYSSELQKQDEKDLQSQHLSKENPCRDFTKMENRHTKNPDPVQPYQDFTETDFPYTDFQPQIIKDIPIKENDIDNHIISYQSKMNNIKRGTKRDGMDMMDRISAYRELIRKNIDYENYPPIYNKQEVDELVDLIVETLMLPDTGTIRIGGKERPVPIVKSMFLKLDKDHICYILKCLHNTEKKIGNIKAYLLTALYNAPMTIQNYYTNLANCDLAPDRQK